MVFEQENRLCRMAKSSGLDPFLVRRFQGREAVSQPFQLEVELETDLAKILGASVTFELAQASGLQRPFNGVVDQIQQVEADLTGAVYRVRLVPWTRLLELRTNCRVFQEMSVPDIVDEVLSDHGVQDIEWRLEGEYQRRVLCVQYRESDWSFIARLLEEEGIAYHYEHEDGRHVLVCGDTPAQRQPCPEQPQAIFRTAEDSDRDEEGMLHDVMQEFRLERSLHSGRRLLSDFNYLDPGASLEAMATADLAIAVNKELEDFEHPGGFVKLGAEDDAKLPFGEDLAAVRAEAVDARTLLARGESTCRGFQAGATFELLNHLRKDCRISWLLLEVQHDLDQSAMFSTSAGGESFYANTIVCLPAKLPYRPARRTPRPTVKGPQTAIVTGPSGEEIHTDQHGRVKVAFHWDRYGARDGSDSCWVRVAHGWAGAGWGMQFTPRIGHEVMVEFLEGDPDRPLITGSVYNGKNAIPFSTPTQSGIRTRSSKEGGAANCNEIRFEDKKDSEDLFIQAERTLTINVKQASSATVGTDQSLAVKGDRSVAVTGDESVAVEGDQSVAVTGDQSQAVSGDRTVQVAGDENHRTDCDHKLEVGGDHTVEVIGNQGVTATEITLGGSDKIRLEVGGSYIEITSGSIVIHSEQVMVEGTSEAEVSAPTAKLTGGSAAEVGAPSVTITGDSDVTIEGGSVSIN